MVLDGQRREAEEGDTHCCGPASDLKPPGQRPQQHHIDELDDEHCLSADSHGGQRGPERKHKEIEQG